MLACFSAGLPTLSPFHSVLTEFERKALYLLCRGVHAYVGHDDHQLFRRDLIRIYSCLLSRLLVLFKLLIVLGRVFLKLFLCTLDLRLQVLELLKKSRVLLLHCICLRLQGGFPFRQLLQSANRLLQLGCNRRFLLLVRQSSQLRP